MKIIDIFPTEINDEKNCNGQQNRINLIIQQKEHKNPYN